MGSGGLNKKIAAFCIQFTVFMFPLTLIDNLLLAEPLSSTNIIFNISWFTLLIIFFAVSTKIPYGDFIQIALLFISGIITVLVDYTELVALLFFITAFLLLFVYGYLQNNFVLKFICYIGLVFVSVLVSIFLNNDLVNELGYLLGYAGILATFIRIIHAVVQHFVAKNLQYLEQCLKIYKIAASVIEDSPHKMHHMQELKEANLELQKIIGVGQSGINKG